MNQKRITNQILTQELSLNSTLNYLFNISNMKKLFSYLLISSMVVLSSCTNYDDQFDDLNSQINSLKGQIEGFSSLSSGLTALQGTVASLQSAVANIPVTPATDISGLESDLDALATAVEALQSALANAATAAEVAALQTALAAQQADLTELLNQNNIYAPTGGTLTVSNQAQLDFATALGNKVAIINGAVSITQTASMDAAQLGALMGKITSVTGAVAYTATDSSTTSQSFSNLTGALSVNLNQTGDISMPKLATTGALTLAGDTKTTSVSFPALTGVTSGLSALSFSKATSVSFPVLAKYDGAISVTTDNDATVDFSALTSAAASVGYTTIDALTVVNASVLTAPMFDKGAITANKVLSVDLPKWEGTAASSFAKAKTAVLPSISATKTANLSFDVNAILPEATSVHVIGKSVAGSTTTYEVSVSTTGQDNLETLILGGVFDAITIKNNTDLVSLDFDATAEDVTIDNTDLVDASIAFTAAGGASSSTSKPTLTVQNNDALNSFTATKVDGLKGLTIKDNRNLKTVAMADLDSAAAEATVTITGNDFSGTVTYSNSTSTAGTLASTSGLKELKAFLDSAITGRKGSVAMQVELDDATAISSTGVESNPNPYYIVNLIDAVTTGGDDAVARQIAYDLGTNGSGNLQIMIGSDALYVNSSNAPTAITPSANVALAISELKSAAAVSRAAALGLNLDVVEGGKVASLNVVFKTALNSATNETTLATTSNTTIATDDFATLTIGSQSVTATTVASTASSTAGIAKGLANAWNTKYGSASTLYSLDADTTSGTIAISVNRGSGNRAHNDAVAVSYSTGTSTATTPLLDWVIGATNATTDNKLKGGNVIILLENTTVGVTGVTSPTVTFSGSLTDSATLTSADDHTAAKALGYQGNVWPTEARGLAVNAWDGTSLVVTTAAQTTDRTAFL
ncbi:MAG: hypothetical protein MRY51_05960 [Flavobacteriaceae bacterium]|nr:hypothetical protein [Flavobacteriaceae bacterium]MCI5087796.1 hypothetical protein [Flavobacteriaceae bacterium]